MINLFSKMLCSQSRKISGLRIKNAVVSVGKDLGSICNRCSVHTTSVTLAHAGESLKSGRKLELPVHQDVAIISAKSYSHLNCHPSFGKTSNEFLAKTNNAEGWGRFDHQKSSAFSAILLLAFTYSISDLLSPDDEEDCAFKRDGSSYCNLLLKRIKSVFTVDAAKPFSTSDEDEGFENGKGGKGDSRRKQFNFIADTLEVVEGAVVCLEVKDHSTVNWYGMPQSASNGSGFIVREDGLILTNAHVVASQQRCSITVKLKDGRCYPGYVEDVDYESDLATVRVYARGLPTLKLGCSAETRVGEWVIAVGSPLNLSNTVTAGIVSTTRKASELGIHANDINYIQTDAAITFGNSGGPLINLDCEAIGINSMKVTPGISFAIPIDHAKAFLEKAERRRASGGGLAFKRYMGLTILTLTDEIRRELETRTGIVVVKHGVFVWQVVRGGPAFLAGVQPGDVIMSINDQPVSSAAQVHDIVKTADTLVVEIQRGKKVYKLTVVPENVHQVN